jgi:hypothetical protein
MQVCICAVVLRAETAGESWLGSVPPWRGGAASVTNFLCSKIKNIRNKIFIFRKELAIHPSYINIFYEAEHRYNTMVAIRFTTDRVKTFQ